MSKEKNSVAPKAEEYAVLTIRVPVSRLKIFLQNLEKIANVTIEGEETQKLVDSLGSNNETVN